MGLGVFGVATLGWASSRKHECLAWYNKVACSSLRERRRCGGSSPFDAEAYNAEHTPPRIAFLLVGDVRTFNASYASYRKHVVDSFAAHADSRVFLLLKNAEKLDLAPIRQALRPAAVLLEDARDAHERTLPLREPWCHRNWLRPPGGGGHGIARSLSWEIVSWWGAMANVWRLVESYEAMRPAAARFERVVLARPDISYDTGMGPWCGYRADTWYTGDHGITPDMFWVMPREHAERALVTSMRTLVECTRGQSCCNSTVLTGRSMWMTQYWGTHGGLRVETNALLGQAVLARNTAKPKGGAAGRDCTLHVGCWRSGDHSEEISRG